MKTMSKVFGISILAFLLIATSCNKSNRTGSLSVRMTDAPADFDSVNVELLEVHAHYSDNANGPSGWQQLDAVPGMYNLLDLQNDVTVVIADQDSLDVGHITQVRLILGQNNYAVEDSTIHFLGLSSQDETGLKINLNADITANETLEVILDFDAMQSIVTLGGGGYKLKPVIKVESINYL